MGEVQNDRRIVFTGYEACAKIQNKQVLYKYFSIRMLGEMIGSDIELHGFLEEAMEMYAKNYSADAVNVTYASTLLDCKYGNTFQGIVRNLFFKGNDDTYYIRSSLMNILELIDDPEIERIFYALHIIYEEMEIDFVNFTYNFLTFIEKCEKSNNKEAICICILKLKSKITTEFDFILSPDEVFEKNNKKIVTLRNEITEQIKFIFQFIWKTLLRNDPEYCFIIASAFAEIAAYITEEIAPDGFIEYYFNMWLHESRDDLRSVSSLILSKTLRPSLNLEWLNKYEGIREIILENYRNPKCNFDQETAIFLGILTGIDWNRDELEVFFSDSSVRHPAKLFIKYLGLNIKEPERQNEEYLDEI
jgi:hypothetical protein